MFPKLAIYVLLSIVALQGGLVRGGDEFTTAAARKAFEEYLTRIDAIERVAAERKAEAKERLTRAIQETAKFEAEAGARYRGMLGSYSNSGGRIPFIMLGVPSGENVFGEH